jgi:membrane protein DedA with SNARE-associated domain
MNYDRKYLLSALGFAVIGMTLGIIMAASHDHVQHVTHAHILLIGFVVSMMYAVIHKLWLRPQQGVIARTQFILHHLGAVGMSIGLFLLFSQTVPEEKLVPLLSGASLAVLVAMILMLVMVLKAKPEVSS